MMSIERLLYRPAEAAIAIGVSRSRMYELITSGEIPSIRLGGTWRVPVESLRQWIKKQLSAEESAAPVAEQGDRMPANRTRAGLRRLAPTTADATSTARAVSTLGERDGHRAVG